ncbi:stage V sporulation protein K [Paenactinomyces guangxiensis]|uniref:Stage V sporulation protein K n=1 Tax=Paenactinomyces guangxiensis TaxID=1490290 RepID=A0A7W1WR86_9BACL|nr:stage V sporulation protein K [Paenactinomyces guangxiensis]MBA4494444.1 stage V sporulation protein K [Paenactinomyces guangxiensis]MBH8591501.1 stage V sporulation protein K [Paenactinomyces guangxiensis]
MSRRVVTGNAKHQIHVVFDHQKNEIHAMPHPGPEEAGSFPGKEEHGPLRECLNQLNQLVGLSQVKEFVREIYAWLEVGKRRRAAGLLSGQQVLHMVFTGNPGTGKTTVARILSRLFQEMGVLSKGHLIEVERADLVGEYIGHTAQKTRDHVRKALGGILFIDEAYSLARGGDKDFGKEAIDTMVKSMEDYKNDFVLILAGYSEEMEHFLRSNPGLPSRFPIHLTFPDFLIEQLLEIAEQMVKERQYRLSLAAKEKLRNHLQKEMNRNDRHFGNARYVRNLIEQAVRHQAVRLLNMRYPSRDDLMILRGEDFQLEDAVRKAPVYSWYN